MGLFDRDHGDDRICGDTRGMCPSRSTMSPGGRAISNPHQCDDYIEANDETHGKSARNQHTCGACKSFTWYKS